MILIEIVRQILVSHKMPAKQSDGMHGRLLFFCLFFEA
jgi:hypothetical protein